MKTTFYIILLLITVSSCTKETMQNDTNEEPIFENVIYLDFNGGQPQSPDWNNGQPFNVSESGLSKKDQKKVMEKVKGYFSLFKVTVTDKESIYLQANAANRQTVILTASSDWNGTVNEPGVALLGSWGTETPCFVFTPARYFNPEGIAIVAAHELGHTLNLYHQSIYDENCNKLNEYRNGSIMGIVDSLNNDHWTIGQSSLGCDSIQDDVKKMAEILSFK